MVGIEVGGVDMLVVSLEAGDNMNAGEFTIFNYAGF